MRRGINLADETLPGQPICRSDKIKTRKEYRNMGRISAFITDESGATAIEYGLLAALISIAALAAMKVVGTKLSTTFSTVGASL
jgi:pilus assembly protein Flp/PilA